MLRRPLTRLEALLSIVIVAVLIAVMADRLLDQMELAERTAMELTVSQVNSGINIWLAYERLRGEAAEPRALERNPFELARMSPPNFLGEMKSARLPKVEQGSWVYDGWRRELIYLPHLKRSLRTRDPDRALRFRLQPVARGQGYMLVPTSKYEWQ